MLRLQGHSDGSIRVITRFDVWRAMHFTAAELANPAISGPNAPSANPPLTVLGAYAFGHNPRQFTGPAFVWISTSAGVNAFHYRRRKEPSGMTYIEKTSTDLLNWSTGTLTTLSITDDGNGETETVKLQPITAPGPRLFFSVEAVSSF